MRGFQCFPVFLFYIYFIDEEPILASFSLDLIKTRGLEIRYVMSVATDSSTKCLARTSYTFLYLKTRITL